MTPADPIPFPETERIVARVACAERDAAHAALTAAGVDDGREEGDPPTGYSLTTRIGLLVEERNVLRAHVADLREALAAYDDHTVRVEASVVVPQPEFLGRNFYDGKSPWSGVREKARVALAATPADSLAHVRAEAIRSVAQEIREQDDYTVGETLSRAEASRIAGWLGARAAAIERGEP